MASVPSSPFRLVAAVMLTCAVAAAGLSVTYALTKDRIAEQERLAVERALSEVVGGQHVDLTFTEADEGLLERAGEAAGETPVYAIHRAESAAGELAGWGVLVGPRGYGGPVRMVVGVDSAGKVTGVSIITHRETPGLGDKVVNSLDYLASFVGMDAAGIEAEVKKVDAITGATKSSRSVRKGVETAGHVYNEVLAEEGSR